MDHTKPGTPGDILEHHGVKGMRWGIRKKEETSGDDDAARETAQRNEAEKKKLTPNSPEFKERLGRVTRTDRPQVIGAQPIKEDSHGLTRNQKIALTFGAAGAAAAGYYAYTKFSGGQMPGLTKIQQEKHVLDGMEVPKHWDVSGLRDHPISHRPLGDLAGGNVNLTYLHPEDLVINTSRGYADILHKDGIGGPYARAQHESITRVLEQMREKYPAIRNMNVEVAPMSAFHGVADPPRAHMSVLATGPGEARILWNDLMDAPTADDVRANRHFLPGLGKKDYVAYHEMGHLLAAAHGEIPPATDILSENATRTAWTTRQKFEPLLHRRLFAKHGFTFRELSELSGYASTEPSEAMAELVGHFHQPQMRARLTPDQIRRAEAMINEMGGLS